MWPLFLPPVANVSRTFTIHIYLSGYLWKLLVVLLTDEIAKSGEVAQVEVETAVMIVAEEADEVVEEGVAMAVIDLFGWTSMDPQPVQITEL